MIYYIKINKKNNRVIGYSSSPLNNNGDFFIQKTIDNSNNKYNELLLNPFIFKFINDDFEKDLEYQNELIQDKNKRLTDKERIINLTKELANNKLENMKKNNIINVLTKQQANIMLEIMKLKGEK